METHHDIIGNEFNFQEWDLDTITSKWVYKIKVTNVESGIEKLKARIVARDFEWTHGLDYFQTFGLVKRWERVRLVVALTMQKKWEIMHLDVKTMLLNGELSEKFCMQQP